MTTVNFSCHKPGVRAFGQWVQIHNAAAWSLACTLRCFYALICCCPQSDSKKNEQRNHKTRFHLPCLAAENAVLSCPQEQVWSILGKLIGHLVLWCPMTERDAQAYATGHSTWYWVSCNHWNFATTHWIIDCSMEIHFEAAKRELRTMNVLPSEWCQCVYVRYFER